MSNYIELCNKMAEEGFDKTVLYEYNFAGIPNFSKSGSSKIRWFFVGTMGLGSVDSWIADGSSHNTTFLIGANVKTGRFITNVLHGENKIHNSDIKMAQHLASVVIEAMSREAGLIHNKPLVEIWDKLLDNIFDSYNEDVANCDNNLQFVNTNKKPPARKPVKLRIL